MPTLTPCLHPEGYLRPLLVEHWTLWKIKAFISFFFTHERLMGQVMSLLRLVGGIRQLQYTLLIILHLHPLLLNTKGGSQYHTAERCLQFFNISLAS